MPGKLLNRLNPLKGLSDDERKELIAEFRHMSEAYGNRDLRLALMDGQGIEAALMYPNTAHDIEFEFADRVDAMYANARSFNRWVYEEIGYAYENRMFLPPYIPLADVDLAVQELDTVMEQGAPLIQIKSGHAHGGRANPFGGKSVADPEFDPIWSRVNEAGIGLTVHLGGTDYQKYGADWSEDPELTFGDFTAFQWMMYWGDRPAMELTAALILHNFFGRFPNINVCLSEQGTVWVPYTIRKMDHAFLMGRKAKWGTLEARPSEIFRQHFLVAPYPEENVQRVVAEVGIDPIVFGSDFPHGEGLAFPAQYVGAQLASFSEHDQKRIMRDNLSEFFGLVRGNGRRARRRRLRRREARPNAVARPSRERSRRAPRRASRRASWRWRPRSAPAWVRRARPSSGGCGRARRSPTARRRGRTRRSVTNGTWARRRP